MLSLAKQCAIYAKTFPILLSLYGQGLSASQMYEKVRAVHPEIAQLPLYAFNVSMVHDATSRWRAETWVQMSNDSCNNPYVGAQPVYIQEDDVPPSQDP